ncbi:single-stranded-DNA-specific exonuclease RecJ [Marinithermofilum abyssi]|nr:single-stranded-DNA-specific exonuclease RecJ [Marinithermofilum abyssi]
MLRSKTRWQSVAADPARIRELSEALGVNPLIARLLVNRGLDDVDRARRFLHVEADGLYDPILMDGMEDAVQRIRRALDQEERIWIYGDYDADGVSSTGLMMRVFRQLQADVDYYIPNRFTEGYGLNRDALQKAKEAGVDLIISVDTGISAVEEAQTARELGLDLIITDHHEPPETLPEALAVINPKKPGCPYPFEMLAGVGVAFKLAQALLGRVPEEVLEVAALGTIADLVPLVDENRILAALGLERMNRRKHVGLSALLEVSGIEGEVNAGHVGFSLGPRINASGRLDSAGRAVELLLTEDPEEAHQIAKELDGMNRERQQLVEMIADEASAMVASEPDRHRRVIVVAGTGWNVGVIGIVASRLVEKYYRPAIVLGIDEETGTAKGSARSIAGFDIYRALARCADLLPHFGGHQMAAGMSLPAENLSSLHERLNGIAEEWLTEEDYIPLTQVDAELTVQDVNLDLIEQLEQLQPYGIGNPTPRFRITGAKLGRMQLIGREKNHVKMALEQEGITLDAVGFRMGELAEEIAPRSRVELLGELQINEWNQRRSPQLLVRDVAVPHLQLFDWRGNGIDVSRFDRLIAAEDALFIGNRKEQPDLYLRVQSGSAVWKDWDEIQSPAGSGMDRTFTQVVFAGLPPCIPIFERCLRSQTGLHRIYFAYGDAEWDDGLVRTPEREHFKQLYAALLRAKRIDLRRDLEKLSRVTGLSKRWIRFMMQVFDELGFVHQQQAAWEVVTPAGKRPLTESELYRKQQDREQVIERLVYSSYRDLCHYVSTFFPHEMKAGGTENGLQRENSRNRGLPAAGSSV